MRNICDFMIIQRGADGFGSAVFAGEYRWKDEAVVARVVSEDNNLMVVPWQVCEVKDGEWRTELRIPQGGLYRVEARLAGELQTPQNNGYDWRELIACASHVGVGDVFVMAGQSNMSGYAKDPAYDPPELGVHMFDNSGHWTIAAHPMCSVPNPIYPNNDPASGVSPGLAFGKMMRRELGVPVGIVTASLGGSSLESWNPAEENPFLYHSMVSKLEEVGNFTAMLWYQGCNETTEDEEAQTYLEKFKQTVTLWREKFGDFSIVTCQLNRHAWKEEDRDRNWGIVREAQRQAARVIPGVFVVPTVDMYTSDGIHNSSGACIIIGERMASALLKGHYGRPGVFAPNINHIKRLDSRTIMLTFDNESEFMLRTMDDLASGLNIEDENGLMDCVKILAWDGGAKVIAERDIGKNAVFHAYWRREQPAFFIRDIYGMPMLACYGVKIED